MNTHIETRSEDLIDLGAASVETKGQSKFPKVDSIDPQQRDTLGIAED